ncbi:AAA family ATPase [Paenibacillus sp. JX-17]|uniref:Nuclease SbcCD subunit C n=1 Tax=Paenibacillus lacisoli TaxID=3064525 RepID=A0ABT9C886_9BACL|nr:AAA family ATPase [Paenibacillus sp. JX-17]MDO7905466.1 AAA family ATPase [Paenibacillus sp. JX-17]
MKPILLKIAGLQSYREAQEIHFEKLTETGLFGIFGPTGSGKSTILDAITLAMYGKVERAVNGTQGIMNHSEDSLAVAFTFELMSANGPLRYRVERRFKRNNEISVSNTVSRFIEITPDGDQVLADKLADVTRCVEERIGLKMDDFTRAVVLPQGKFAEFLSLKGTERRQMLQRLFHLERYGDQLGIKLSRRVKETDGALKALEAEQQGLGQADASSVEEAKTAVETAVRLAEEARALLDAASREAEALSKQRELQQEQTRRQEELDTLSSREQDMTEMERKLRLAAEANGMMPVLRERKSSAVESERRHHAAAAAEQQSGQAETAAREAAGADLAARQVLSEEEPKLLLRLDQLEQARQLQIESRTLEGEVQQLAIRQDGNDQKRSRIEQQLLKEQELHTRGQKKQQELQELLKQYEVRASERRQLQEAIQLLQQLNSQEDQLRQLSEEERLQEGRLQQSVLELEQTRKLECEQQQQQQQLAYSAAEALEQLLVLEAACTAELAGLDADEVLLRQELRAGELRRLSLSLAAELRDGEPCPVCGGMHHPAPAAPGDEEAHAGEAALAALQQLRSELHELRLNLRQQLHERRSLLEQLGAAQPEAAAAAASPQPKPASDAAGRPARCAGLTRQAAGLAAAGAPLRAAAAGLREAASAAGQARMKAAAEQEAAEQALAQVRRKREAAASACEAMRSEWAQRLPDLQPETAASQYEAMQERDSRAEEIRGKLDISVTFLEDKVRLVQQLRQEMAELDKQLAAGTASLEGKQALLREKEERLRAWIGDQQVESLLQEAQSRLSGLKADAERAAKAHRAADETRQELAKQAVMARQAADSAREYQQSAVQRWEELLQASSFDDEAEVTANDLEPAVIQRFGEETRLYRERQRELHAQLRHVEEQLGGTVVSEEQWQEARLRFLACRQQDEEALQQRARALRDLEDLQQRHERWTVLEEQRKRRQAEADQLSKLQSCLRGNAFVEYIAEEQLMQVSQAASQRLRFLTKQRYSLEVDSSGGFVICDDANGGMKRPVSTLSGGETFLTSLSLALALSAQIQLRGQYPLQFFFLDEGFGTLDPELLDTVITSLEKLHHDKLSVGVISHVPELRARLPRKLVVVPAGHAGGGSKVVMESL